MQKALRSQVLKFPRSTANVLPKSKEMQIPKSSAILNKGKEKERLFIHTASTNEHKSVVKGCKNNDVAQKPSQMTYIQIHTHLFIYIHFF